MRASAATHSSASRGEAGVVCCFDSGCNTSCVARVSGPSAVHRDVKASYQVTYRALRLRKPGGGRRLCERQHRLKRGFRFRVRIGFGVVFRSAPKSLFVPLLVFSRPQVVDVVDSKRLVNHADTRARSLFLGLVSLINSLTAQLAKQDFHPIRLQQMLPQRASSGSTSCGTPRTPSRARSAAHCCRRTSPRSEARRAAEPGI